MSSSVQSGNADEDGANSRGWLVGHFIDASKGLRQSDDVEIKWGTHQAGEERAEWVTGETRTTFGFLVSGKWQTIFRDQTVTLSKPGDYVMWGPVTDHKWQALEDTIIVTVRWPSVTHESSSS